MTAMTAMISITVMTSTIAMNSMAAATAMTAITFPLGWLGFIGESAILRHTGDRPVAFT